MIEFLRSAARLLWVEVHRNPDWFRDDVRALLELLREDKSHAVVAERLPPSDARRAHELLESSAGKGKLVLVPQCR